MRFFNHKVLAIAIASVGAVGTAHAAGLDRSGQDVTAFLQDGTYAEAVYTYIDANISGKDQSGNEVKDISAPYNFVRYGAKADVNDVVSIGVLYDEPFGAAVKYTGTNDFVSDQDKTAQSMLDTVVERMTGPDAKYQEKLAGTMLKGIAFTKPNIEKIRERARDFGTPPFDKIGEVLNRAADIGESTHGQGTNVDIRTNNISLLFGAKVAGLQIYGGPVAQRLTGEVHLRGTAYSGLNGYDAKISPDHAVGWLAGASYSKPEIALKAALTYRSAIKHETNINEMIPVLGFRGLATENVQKFKVTTPKSWNFDFQTGLSAKHRLLGTAKVRYVPWSQFDVRPPAYGKVTEAVAGKALPIVSYPKDQWGVELGLGKQINDKLSIAGNIGWDSGAGNPTTSLGPIKGYYSVGGGVKYNVTPQVSVSLGGKYLKFGNATALLPTGAKVGEFKDNDGFIAGVKLAYHAK